MGVEVQVLFSALMQSIRPHCLAPNSFLVGGTSLASRGHRPTWRRHGVKTLPILAASDALVRVLPNPDLLHIVVCVDLDATAS